MFQTSYTSYTPPSFFVGARHDSPVIAESPKAYEKRILNDIKLAKEERWVIICHHAFRYKEDSLEWKALAEKYFVKWQVGLKQKSPMAALYHQLTSLKVLRNLGKSSTYTAIMFIVMAVIAAVVLGAGTAGIAVGVFALLSGISTLGLFFWTRHKTVQAAKIEAAKEFTQWSDLSNLCLDQCRDQNSMERLCQFFDVPNDMIPIRIFLFLNTLHPNDKKEIYANILIALYEFKCHKKHPETVEKLLDIFVIYKNLNSLTKNTPNEKIESICSLLFFARIKYNSDFIDIYDSSRLITDLLLKHVYGDDLSVYKKMQLGRIVDDCVEGFFKNPLRFDNAAGFTKWFCESMEAKMSSVSAEVVPFCVAHKLDKQNLLGPSCQPSAQRAEVVSSQKKGQKA